jgi:beta-glucosidase
MKTRSLILLVVFANLLAACGGSLPASIPSHESATPVPPTKAAPTPSSSETASIDESIEARVEDLLTRMTLEEKIGQMTQVEKNSIKPGDITNYFIGSILSGGGGYPNGNNTAQAWAEMIDGFQDEALATRLGIPLIYGVDAVHGHGNLKGATIFPHQIGLGAANDATLVEAIGRATAIEMLATGATWNFAPVVAVPQDIRWGRTYESYSESTELVSRLASAYITGLQSQPESSSADSIYVLATPKHYLGDGGTTFGTSTQFFEEPYLLDQGDMRVDEETILALYLPAYQAAVDAGAMSVMASFNSWNGTKMHAQKGLISDVLKGELGFQGFVVSDWGGMDQISSDYYTAIVTSVNAGVDMNMVPYDYIRFIDTMKEAVAKGDIKEERIDDAVRRILTVKLMLGLFDHPKSDPGLLSALRSAEHLALAREAVRKSLVLLKNDNEALPIAKETTSILVAGLGADNLGMQSGGWTLEWQGVSGNLMPGTSILDAINATVSTSTRVQYNRFGKFEEDAEVGIVVVGEEPYTEGVGDADDLRLSEQDINAIHNTRAHVKKLIVVILSGRPLIITDQLDVADAWVAAWLPGTEGQGISDVLFGDYLFTGKLPYSWPRSNEQIPININNAAGKTGCDEPLFQFGYGLAYGEETPQIPKCDP